MSEPRAPAQPPRAGARAYDRVMDVSGGERAAAVVGAVAAVVLLLICVDLATGGALSGCRGCKGQEGGADVGGS